MKAATSADILDWIQAELSHLAVHQAAVAGEEEEAPLGPRVSRKVARRQLRQRSTASWSPYQRLFGSKSLKLFLKEMVAVSPVVYPKIQKAWHPADTKRRLAMAHQLLPAAADQVGHPRARIFNDLVAATALEQTHPNGDLEQQMTYEQAKDAFIIHAICSLRDSVAAGRVTEALSLLEPASLAAWLTSSKMSAVHNYILALLVKENKLEVHDSGRGHFRSMIRYWLPHHSNTTAAASDLTADIYNSARKHLRRVAISELPPRVVQPPPQKLQKQMQPHLNDDVKDTSATNHPACSNSNPTAAGKEEAGEQLAREPSIDSTLNGQHNISKRKLLRMLKHHSLLLVPEPS